MSDDSESIPAPQASVIPPIQDTAEIIRGVLKASGAPVRPGDDEDR